MKKLKLEELNRLNVEEFKAMYKIPVVIVLDNIRSALNVGSVFRTSDAFLIDKIYLTGITATPPNKEIFKTAIGATKSVEWQYVKDVKEACLDLIKAGYTLIGIEQTNKSLSLQNYVVNKDEKYAIVMGNEVQGLSDDILPLLNAAIEIPQFGTKHSLNVSVCTGICLWHFVSAFKL